MLLWYHGAVVKRICAAGMVLANPATDAWSVEVSRASAKRNTSSAHECTRSSHIFRVAHD
jgi:hypothetical protein